ncbi:hypothetical protein ABID21_003220 [Pseudorhizobium tarimense]|uniref:DUF2125 domain-containing protein n=1 Tax=Pseudorhizobium tarimense TaxID=1079109 RepID=A0ABV2H989_9HYPH|nr:DUF2125 domain-containing protein [Pseudorhizobium tarimense]MCJ8520267.1 DUF2125 domain-containing protein [Pseudorhizobium tarimense]
MAASSRTSVSRKIWLLATAIVLAIALYTGGWFYAAHALKEKTLALLGSQEANGITAQCTDATYRGYPFRIGLFCSSASLDDRNNGISATIGALRSAAQVYDPGHIVWEADAPAQLRTSHGLTVSSDWESLQSSLIAKHDGVERSSTVIRQGTTSIVSTAAGQSLNIGADRTEMHLRQNGADLDAALLLENARVTAQDVPELLPPVTATVDVTLVGRGGIIDGTDPNGITLYGTQGEMHSLSADLGEGRTITVSGPFSIDEEGYLSGKLKLKVDQIEAWRNSLAQAFPEVAPVLQTVAGMLSALNGGGQSASIDLTVNHGKVFAGGFIPVGEIPPI